MQIPLPFKTDALIKTKPPMVDVSIAVHLCLRAAQYSYTPDEFREHIRTAHLILDAFGMAGDYLPNRYDSRLLFQKAVLEFVRTSVLGTTTSRNSRRQLLTRLKTVSESVSITSAFTSTSQSTTKTDASTYDAGLLRSLINTTHSKSESETKTDNPETRSQSTQTAMDGKNVRLNDLLSGYERLLQNAFNDSFLQYFMRYHRASQSQFFIQKVEHAGVELWQKYLDWWLAAYDQSERQTILLEASGQDYEIAPQEIFATTITVRPAYRSVEGWILEHLTAPYSGYPNPRFLRMLIGIADAYRADTAQDIYGTLHNLHDWLERSKELETFIGDVQPPTS